MRYARTFLATFAIVLAAAATAPNTATDDATQAFTLPDGSCIVIYDPETIII